MPVENAADLAAFFSTDDFAEAATYRPASGPDVAVSVIVDRPTREVSLGGLAVSAPAIACRLRSSEVAQPRKGDAITIGAATYTIAAAPERESGGLIWHLTLGEP